MGSPRLSQKSIAVLQRLIRHQQQLCIAVVLLCITFGAACALAGRWAAQASGGAIRDAARTSEEVVHDQSPQQQMHMQRQTDGVFDALMPPGAPASRPDTAIATLITTDGYAAGTVTLAYTLRKHGNRAPLFLLHSSQDPPHAAAADLYRRAGWQIRPVDPIWPFKGDRGGRFDALYTKLRVWELTDFSYVLYIDSDGLVLGHVESAVDMMASARQAAAQHVPAETRPPAPDIAAVTTVNEPISRNWWNAGLMVLRPNASELQTMMAEGPTFQYSAVVAEQAFLNQWYADRWLALPAEYNILRNHRIKTPELWGQLWRHPRFVHYAAKWPRVMAHCIEFSDDGRSIVSTQDCSASQRDEADVLWVQEWLTARHMLRLPCA